MAKWLKVTIISVLISAIIGTGIWLLYYFGIIDKAKQYSYQELMDMYDAGVEDTSKVISDMQITIDGQKVTIKNLEKDVRDKNRTITALQSELENKYTINTIENKNLIITIDGQEYTSEIQTNTSNSITTKEVEYSGSFADLDVIGPWLSIDDINLQVNDIVYYTFEINDKEISTEPTTENVTYSMAQGVSPEIHLFVNTREVMANQESMFNATSSDSVTWSTSVEYSLNENNEFTSLVITTRILGEIN